DGHQRLGHKAPAVGPEMAARVRLVPGAGQSGAGLRDIGGAVSAVVESHTPSMPAAAAATYGGMRAPGRQRAGLGHDGCDPAATRSDTITRGSPEVTSPSPTSTASAPAPA